MSPYRRVAVSLSSAPGFGTPAGPLRLSGAYFRQGPPFTPLGTTEAGTPTWIAGRVRPSVPAMFPHASAGLLHPRVAWDYPPIITTGSDPVARICYNGLVMDQVFASAAFPHRQRHSWLFAPGPGRARHPGVVRLYRLDTDQQPPGIL